MVKRFIVAFFTFIGLIIPAAFALAFMAAPARPQPLERPGCERNLADAIANVAAQQTRVKRLGAARSAEACSATMLYFLEVVKARAVTALCKSGTERDRDLGRLDTDVETINNAIATSCS
ncbi:MAG TPA: hypothetical protein VFC45_13175 [Pseudolabrys sp.]|nr:hypothetical protein [Pseudolabrys sp.]